MHTNKVIDTKLFITKLLLSFVMEPSQYFDLFTIYLFCMIILVNFNRDDLLKKKLEETLTGSYEGNVMLIHKQVFINTNNTCREE